MMTTNSNDVGIALREATHRLAAAGVDSPRLDARLLLAHALNVTPESLAFGPSLLMDDEHRGAFSQLLARRCVREPVARILGQRGFWTLTLTLSADTLDPRPDTETVVESVLAAVPDRDAALSILDFGVGSGCILLALLSELPNARGLGIDLAPGAVDTARENAAAAGLSSRAEFRVGDWGEGLSGRFDIIVSNPPYIADAEFATLAPEVIQFDPRLALSGGSDGLDAYRALAPEIARLLGSGGVAVLEVGAGQVPLVVGVMTAAGLAFTTVRADLNGVERCVVLKATT